MVWDHTLIFHMIFKLRSDFFMCSFPDLVMVHAGLHPHWTDAQLERLTKTEIDFAVTVRYCDAEGRRPAADWKRTSSGAID